LPVGNFLIISENSKTSPPDSIIFFAAEFEIDNDETETLCEMLPVPKF